ncbi:glutathione hydrolase 1-like [Macadamia integrifolia]|uniref:glutathione hydrolase 1-like n=1 Tax=Macadamia integrifolia TaxID=60698 RepID=UPI001C530FC0|nr:glutathione hydrolase 1-like [Macadamia integrifolia]
MKDFGLIRHDQCDGDIDNDKEIDEDEAIDGDEGIDGDEETRRSPPPCDVYFSKYNMYGGNSALKASGALSIAVPGELAGLHKAWKEHGRLPWKRLVRPTEYLARKGFKISPYLYMQMNKSNSGIFADKGLRNIFTSNGKLLQPGVTCHNRKLAQTLNTISKYGPNAFYNGSVRYNLVRDVQKFGGISTMQDLEKYQVKVKKPISANISGLEILSMPPPSRGAAMILVLNILVQYGFPLGISRSLGILREIEALK